MIDCFKTKYTSKDVESGYNFPADDAKVFIEKIKPRLIGNKLKQILINSFYWCGETCNETETFTEWAKRYTPQEIEWNNPLILCIENDNLEISLWMPDCYALSLNIENIDKIIDTDKVPFMSIYKKKYGSDSTTYYDISACFKTLIGQRIKNIELVANYYTEKHIPEDEYLENITITLENGTVFKICDKIDSATIEIIKD